METVEIILFSPTGTTRKVLEAIAEGLAARAVDYRDMTKARSRTGPLHKVDADLALIGTPVYTGRVPIQVEEALRTVRGAQVPAVPVVVYGNRAYEDALLELKAIAEEVGFKPVAGAAFIGEHSFSTKATPLAVGRPDKEDLEKARAFGKLIREMLEKGASRDVRGPEFPGNFPYRERISLSISPESSEDLCVRCFTCREACPQEAVTVVDERINTDINKCIICCACVKACPTGARQVTDSRITQLMEKLVLLCRDRKEPELFYGITH